MDNSYYTTSGNSRSPKGSLSGSTGAFVEELLQDIKKMDK
jgi:hypothetical protein